MTLVTGPVALADPPGVETRHVETAREMLAAVEAAGKADVFIGAAAVADWRVDAAQDKLKKARSGAPSLSFHENPDILAHVAGAMRERPSLVVGFAAETRDVIENARAKLKKKRCDLIVANNVGAEAGIFGGDDNEVSLVTSSGVTNWPRSSKAEVAAKLVAWIADELTRRVSARGKAAS